MILAEIIAAAFVASLLTRGSLRALAKVKIRGEWLLIILLPCQILWPQVVVAAKLGCSVAVAIWLTMMGALVGVLAVNAPRQAALGLAALGIMSNFLVIGANQAMPVSIRAASEVGESREEVRAALERDCLHEELGDATRLPLLADIVPIPGPSWQRGVVSLGDLLLAVGIGAWVFTSSRRSAT